MSSSAGPINSGGVLLLMLQNQQLAEGEAQEARDASHELGVAFLKIGNVYRGLQQSQEEFEDTVQWINAGLSVVSVGQSAVGVAGAAAAQSSSSSNAANANANGANAGSSGTNGSTPTTADPAAAASATQAQADQASKVDARATDGSQAAREGEPADTQRNAEETAGDRSERARKEQEAREDQEARQKKMGVFDYAKGAYQVFEAYSKSQLKLDDEIDKHAEDHSKSASTSFFGQSDRAKKQYDGERKLTKEFIETIRNGDKKDVVG